MTTRDRLVLIGIVSLAILAGVWLLLVSPERKKAAKLSSEVSAASAQLASAEGQVADARGAQARYSSAYASIVSLGKAVPAGKEVPSLIYQLAHASNQKDVEFNSIVSGAGASGSSGGSASSATPAATTLAGFTQMPFTFVFNGSYSDLYHLFQSLNTSTVQTSSGALQVSGRLLTIQSAKLGPASSEGAGSHELSGTITATAYVLPLTQGLTGGATAASPTASPATTADSTSAGSSTPVPAAIVGAGR
jgi:Tfp pilus assembly protein PilO